MQDYKKTNTTFAIRISPVLHTPANYKHVIYHEGHFVGACIKKGAGEMVVRDSATESLLRSSFQTMVAITMKCCNQIR